MTCLEPGCPKPVLTRGRCSAHYQRWRKSPEFVKLPRAVHVPTPDPVCPWCGPYKRRATFAGCPTCGLDTNEIAYAERIIADSAAVLAEEVRAFRARSGATSTL